MEGSRFDGPRARALRQSAGVRMIDLARAIDCTYGHLRMVETSGRQPSTELAYRIARVLSRHLDRDVGIDELSTSTTTHRAGVA